MATTRIKFFWRRPRIENGRWWLGLCAVQNSAVSAQARVLNAIQRRTLYISLRTLCLYAFCLTVTGYFATTVALYKIQQDNPYNRIGYADLALPWRWSGLTALRGQALIEQSKDQFKAGAYGSGFAALRGGLGRNPTDANARLELARIYVLLRQRTQASFALFQAFEHGYPGIEYIDAAYKIIADADDPDTELKFLADARAAWAAASGPAEDERLLDAKRVQSLLKAGRGEQAEELAASMYSENSDDLFGVRLAVALDKKDYPVAASIAGEWLAVSPKSESVISQAAVAYRLAGRYDDMQVCIDRLRELNPVNPAHAAFNVVQNIHAGRIEIARVGLEDALFRFGADPKELSMWGLLISETGRDDFVARIERHMRELGYDVRPILFPRLLAQIRMRDWSAAKETVTRIEAFQAVMQANDRAIIGIFIHLVTACVDGGSGFQTMFIDAFREKPLGQQYVSLFVDVLVDCGRVETARQLIAVVEGYYPDSRYVAKMVASLDAQLAAIAEAREAARPEPAESPDKAYADGAALLADIDQRKQKESPEDVLRLIRTVRRSTPSWLGEVNDGLLLRELDLALISRDMLMLQATARSFMRSRVQNRESALDLAKAWHEQGHKDESLLVVREILKLSPDFEPALKALSTWAPKPVLPDMEDAPGQPPVL